MKRDRCGWSGKRCDCKRISFTTALHVARELFVGIACSWVVEMRLRPIMNDGASWPSNSAFVVARHRKLLGHVVVLRALNFDDGRQATFASRKSRSLRRVGVGSRCSILDAPGWQLKDVVRHMGEKCASRNHKSSPLSIACGIRSPVSEGFYRRLKMPRTSLAELLSVCVPHTDLRLPGL